MSRAKTPGTPVSPRPVRDALLALGLGLVFGLLVAFLRDSFDRRLVDSHEVQRHLDYPLLGSIGDELLGRVGMGMNGSGPGFDPGAEAFKILRANVEFLTPDGLVKTIAVTSALAEEGKSTVAAGLASACALAGKRVLLVECDLRKPVLAERLGLSPQPGLSDWLVGRAVPAEVVQVFAPDAGEAYGEDATPGERGSGSRAPTALATIVAGNASPRPAELLASERFAAFLGQVSEAYDLVILDCAPLLPVGDTLEVLPHSDAVLLCVRVHQTTRDQAHAMKSALDHLPSRPTGAVVTGIHPGRDGNYYYGYYSAGSST